jgi:hypothetical protein
MFAGSTSHQRADAGGSQLQGVVRCGGLTQPIVLTGHVVFHAPSGCYGSLKAHACPTDYAALGPARNSLSSLAPLGGLSGRADQPGTALPGQL